MTGTPSANRPEDYWSQVYFLDKGKSLGESFNTFKSKVKITNKLRNNNFERIKIENNVKNIFKSIEKFSLRETKISSKLNLPDKQFLDHFVDFEERQKKIYNTAVDDLKLKIKLSGKDVEDDLEAFLKRIIRLMQVTSNPKILDETYNVDTFKFLKLKEILLDI